MVYLDNAATTPVRPEAAQAALEVMTRDFGNPSSGYPLGTAAARRRDRDRAAVAAALGCLPEELFFTSCGTEGDNWAVQAAVDLNRGKGRHIVTTAIEHDAVRQPILALEKRGYEVTWLKPDRAGRIAAQAVREAVRPDTVLVSVMLVNNEVGSVLPVRAAAGAIAEKGSPALLHTDAVQAFLKLPFTPEELGADFVAVSGHKVGAPKGIGALYIRKGLIPKVRPLLLGGGQERGLRPGTEATAQIAAFAAAVESWDPEAAERVRAVRDYAAHRLSAIPGVTLITAVGERPGLCAPHILAFSLPGFSGQAVVEALGGQGVCVSSGSACHRGRPSHVFQAMPLPQAVRFGAVRASFSPESAAEDADELLRLIRHICQKKTLLF